MTSNNPSRSDSNSLQRPLLDSLHRTTTSRSPHSENSRMHSSLVALNDENLTVMGHRPSSSHVHVLSSHSSTHWPTHSPTHSSNQRNPHLEVQSPSRHSRQASRETPQQRTSQLNSNNLDMIVNTPNNLNKSNRSNSTIVSDQSAIMEADEFEEVYITLRSFINQYMGVAFFQCAIVLIVVVMDIFQYAELAVVDNSGQQLLFTLDIMTLILFTMEVCINIGTYSWRYFWRFWTHRFDLIFVLLSDGFYFVDFWFFRGTDFNDERDLKEAHFIDRSDVSGRSAGSSESRISSGPHDTRRSNESGSHQHQLAPLGLLNGFGGSSGSSTAMKYEIVFDIVRSVLRLLRLAVIALRLNDVFSGKPGKLQNRMRNMVGQTHV